MRKYFYTVFLFIIAAAIAFAQGIAEPARPMIQLPNGTLVGPTNPLPTTAELGDITFENNITPITEWDQQTLTLLANTEQTLTSGITGNRRFIELKAHDDNARFWLALGASATVGVGRPVDEYVYLELPADVSVSVISSEAISISVVEGGD